MTWATALLRTVMLLLLVGGCGGCGNLFRAGSDEQKDPHYLTGKNRLNNMDYRGAAEAFELALETNPRSSAAHFELGFLYEQKLTNYPAAVFHFQRFLELRPQSEHAEFIRQHVTASIQELARTVPLGPVTPSMQRDLSRLADENLRLRQLVDQLNRRIAELTNVVQTMVATSAPAFPTPVSVLARSLASSAPAASSPPAMTNYSSSSPSPSVSAVALAASARKSYTVQRGDTLSVIARRHGIKLSSLQEANPRIDARRLRPGQVLVIPAK